MRSGQYHRSDPRLLSRRTLERDHRSLAHLLAPGMSVLDVGCGTGAITSGIARRVGPAGWVVGIDRDRELLAIAKREHAGGGSLRFEYGDILSWAGAGEFDVVNAARTIQWIGDAVEAIRKMKGHAKPGGRIVILDYNHAENRWDPHTPDEFARFYGAFLAWREANGWHNRLADRLPGLCHDAGLAGLNAHDDDEISERGEPGFDAAAGIWTAVIQSIGPRLVESGYLREAERRTAEQTYERWVRGGLQRQVLSMKTVIGVVP